MNVLGIAGSLRRASYNRALLEADRELAADSMTIDVFDLDDIPLRDFETWTARHAHVSIGAPYVG